ncbi:MAG: alpha/beta hydrolase [Acidaminococcaceae bacterium]|nr:alpha/beta hydrolase [Acidaminococcaceae bacterium]
MNATVINGLQNLLVVNKKKTATLVTCVILLGLSGCNAATTGSEKSAQNAGTVIAAKTKTNAETGAVTKEMTAASKAARSSENFTMNTPIQDVIRYPAFGNYGRLIFPVNTHCFSGSTLGNLSLTWYSEIRPEKTVEICNYFKQHADAGDTVFYDIYTPEEKAAEPSKNDAGLFFFKGKPGAKFAICSSGGGMVYVGSMHDSFPHALEIAKKGYNAFALIYRAGYQTGPEDLARAIAFIHTHAKELQVDTAGYSLWGGSAGARLAAWLGSHGTEAFGEKPYPRPAAVIMQYTGLSEVTGKEPPTYNCVGTSDHIAPHYVMKARINQIRANGTNAEIEVFPDLDHGFGIGTGTVAEGWVGRAVAFWEKQMK